MQTLIINKIFKLFAWTCSLILVSALFIIIGFLIFKGFNGLNLKLIFSNTSPINAILLKSQVFDGLFPAIFGTVCLIFLSILFAVPMGLATGIFLAEYCPLKIKWFFSLIFDILAGIPSIVIGLFGFSITIFLHHYFNNNFFPCLLISALSLGFLVLPYIIRTTQVALEALPLETRLSALSLGATKLQNIFLVLLPSSMGGILNGVILAIGRCAEDTAVIMLTGAVAVAGIPKSIFSNFEALPFYIYYISSQYSDNAELIKGYSACLILIIICIGLFISAHGIKAILKTKILYKL